jgi:sortase A
MKPDDNTPVPGDSSRRIVQPPQRDRTSQHDAVAQMTREQINQIYTQQVREDQLATVAPQAQLEATSPASDQQPTNAYVAQPQHTPTTVLPEEWQKYHSSWQDYYQKYYEKYYVGAVQQAHSSYKQHAELLQKSHRDMAVQRVSNETMTEDEALYDLRSQLLSKVQTSAKKVRKSRHFVPLISSTLVLMLFAFLQYNSVIFAYAQAYVSPGNIDPQNIIVDPNASLEVSKEPRLIIPKINVDVGVQYKNTMGNNAQETNDLQMAAMRKGVAYFGFPGANAKPGQNGNFGIAGHSSNDFTDSGVAKFVFAPLHDLKKGDTFYLNYEGLRYTYSIKEIKVVAPNNISSLKNGTKKPMVTLITCTPIGTADNRLLVFGEQISPNPATAKKAPTQATEEVDAPAFTGKAPTIFERLFGRN